MTPFLKQVADHYMASGDISSRCLIFPNRRSQVFFKKYLGEAVAATGSPIIAPELLTINDFFYKIAGAQASDRISLLLELYDCYKTLNPSAELLDEFIFWGDVILGDFALHQCQGVPGDPRLLLISLRDPEGCNGTLCAPFQDSLRRSGPTKRGYEGAVPASLEYPPPSL